MDDNPYIQARSRLPTAISTLPTGFLDGNAAKLLAIVEELKRSRVLELSVIQDIEGLDVTNPDAVAQFVRAFRNYHASRDFDYLRTHCHNIDRIARMLVIPLEASATAADRQQIAEVESLLEPLRAADNEYLDEIEPLMDRALEVANQINQHVQADQGDQALQVQQNFTKEFDPRTVELKQVLSQMNRLANELIDHL